jgi:hypothetical protein
MLGCHSSVEGPACVVVYAVLNFSDQMQLMVYSELFSYSSHWNSNVVNMAITDDHADMSALYYSLGDLAENSVPIYQVLP